MCLLRCKVQLSIYFHDRPIRDLDVKKSNRLLITALIVVIAIDSYLLFKTYGKPDYKKCEDYGYSGHDKTFMDHKKGILKFNCIPKKGLKR